MNGLCAQKIPFGNWTIGKRAQQEETAMGQESREDG